MKDGSGLKMALVWACLIVLLASVPYLAGMLLAPGDGMFAGFTYNIDDACVYSSWVRQVADGHVFYRNLYTPEPQSALQFNLLFALLGAISRLTGMSAAAVLHLARVVLGVGLLALVWRFAARFLSDSRARALVVPVVGLGSGLGWILPKVQGHAGSVDLWQPEAITFLSIYLNPLFLAGLVLMLAALHFLQSLEETGRWRDAGLAGLMLLILGNVHTYDVLTVGAVWASYLLVRMISRQLPPKLALQSLVAAAIALPSVAYQFYLYRSVEVFRARVETAAPSPVVWAYLAGFGLLIVLGVIGARLALRERRGMILVVWAVVGFLLPYLPFAQQRKLAMGLHLPIAILACAGIAWVATKSRSKVAALIILILLAPSNLVFMSRDIGMLQSGVTAPLYPAYLSNSEVSALRWIRDYSGERDTVLASREISLFVPAIAGRTVYFGHWSETPDYGKKLGEWMRFITPSTSDIARREYLESTGARWIIYPARPGEYAGTTLFDLRRAPYVRLAYETGNVAVYEVQSKY